MTLALPSEIALKGSRQKAMPLRQCDQHKSMSVPEGGVQVNPNKWMCASCWVKFINRRK